MQLVPRTQMREHGSRVRDHTYFGHIGRANEGGAPHPCPCVPIFNTMNAPLMGSGTDNKNLGRTKVELNKDIIKTPVKVK
jgi:hypothetical protein